MQDLSKIVTDWLVYHLLDALDQGQQAITRSNTWSAKTNFYHTPQRIGKNCFVPISQRTQPSKLGTINVILDTIFFIPWPYSRFNSRQFQKLLQHYLSQVNFYFVCLHIATGSVLLQQTIPNCMQCHLVELHL